MGLSSRAWVGNLLRSLRLQIRSGESSMNSQSSVVRWIIVLSFATLLGIYVYLNWPAIGPPLTALIQALRT